MDLERLRSYFTCLDCIWAGQCSEDQVCEYFDVLEEDKDGVVYDAILKENMEEYRLMMEVYSDDYRDPLF